MPGFAAGFDGTQHPSNPGMLGSTEPNAWVRCPTCLGSMKPKRWVPWDPALDKEGKAAVGFLQVDEDEEGIGVGFDFEPSKRSNLALNPSSNPATAWFLQVLGSISNPASTMFELGSYRCWILARAGFDFEPSKRWVLFPTQLQLDRRIYEFPSVEIALHPCAPAPLRPYLAPPAAPTQLLRLCPCACTEPAPCPNPLCSVPPCCVDLACCNPLHLTTAQSRACSAQRPAQETKRKLSVLYFSACRNQQL
ncbi:hypothetical protein SLEP1_g14948 [Rubroshorea leprosula]|uniref:Uncharacterized protein n=1 Tax=Rubroshorea leprosula TaxID=152421 RepID=A0AAV5IQ54_9ROSI|nr:hypothetical protein SLEP1_g14948 [Rubroshorea leprosula]